LTDVPIGWETPRLVARRAARDAAQDVFVAYARDPDVARYMIWRPHRDLDDPATLDRTSGYQRRAARCALLCDREPRTENPEPNL